MSSVMMANPFLEALAQPLWGLIFFSLLGLCVGSFLNVLIYRLPVMLEQQWQTQAAEIKGETRDSSDDINLFLPRSRCRHCGHEISAKENLPLISYVWLGGKCKACKTPIGLRYPLVEVISMGIGALCFWRYGLSVEMLLCMIFLWVLLALTLIDYDTQLLPDSLTLPLMWLGLIAASMAWIKTPLVDALWGAVAGYLVLWLVYWLFKLITGKEGMGYGDFKLLAALGAWMGWQQLPIIILLSSLVGAVVGIMLIAARKQDASKPIPFGPYLAGAGAIAWFFGSRISAALF